MMESARDKQTGEIVEAEDLWLLEHVNKDGYKCWGCGIDMYPSSWQENSKKRPSFNKKPGKMHLSGCDADAEPVIVNQGQKRSVRQHLDSAPGLCPSGLKLIDKRSVVDPDGNGADNKSSSTFSGKADSDNGYSPAKRSRRPAQTIRPICRFYINFPYDREMSLDVPGVAGDTYQYAFKRLESPIQSYPNQKIFYSLLLLWRQISEDDERLIIPVAGEWVNGKPTKNYQVYVEWASWSKAKRNQLLNELEIVKKEAKEASLAKKDDKGWVFFIGEQDSVNSDIFYVSDSRLICLLTGEVIYPPRSRENT